MLMQNIWKSVISHKLKTSLIFLSLTVTILSIFLITAISQGVITMYSNMLQSNGDIIVTQSKISDTFFSDVNRSLIPAIARIEGVQKVSALIVGASPVDTLPIVAIYGVTQNLYPRYHLQQGRYPHDGEVIVGSAVYHRLHDKKVVQISNTSFHISGVYASKIGFENGGILMPLQSAGTIFHKQASMLLVNIKIGEDIDGIMRHIRALSSAIDVKSTKSFVQNYNQFKIINRSSLVISAIAFFMGLIAIGSIMSVTVLQRKDEFGIMKALGISSWKIARFIMFESLLIAVLSFLTAWALADMILWVIRHSEALQGYVNGTIDMELAFWVLCATILMSLIGASVPVYSALKIDPLTLIQRGNV